MNTVANGAPSLCYPISAMNHGLELGAFVVSFQDFAYSFSWCPTCTPRSFWLERPAEMWEAVWPCVVSWSLSSLSLSLCLCLCLPVSGGGGSNPVIRNFSSVISLGGVGCVWWELVHTGQFIVLWICDAALVNHFYFDNSVYTFSLKTCITKSVDLLFFNQWPSEMLTTLQLLMSASSRSTSSSFSSSPSSSHCCSWEIWEEMPQEGYSSLGGTRWDPWLLSSSATLRHTCFTSCPKNLRLYWLGFAWEKPTIGF